MGTSMNDSKERACKAFDLNRVCCTNDFERFAVLTVQGVEHVSLNSYVDEIGEGMGAGSRRILSIRFVPYVDGLVSMIHCEVIGPWHPDDIVW